MDTFILDVFVWIKIRFIVVELKSTNAIIG
jgi:hypothetical protein